MNVAVCIPTFRRPARLRALLDSLASANLGGAHVIVLDNDAAGTAERVVREHALPRLSYAIEPEPGISAARNRLIAHAREVGCAWVAFVDDDEIVSAHWLDRLLETAVCFNADAVLGPIVPRYADGVPPWVVAGRFFERPRQPTGTRVRAVGLGNALLRLSALGAAPFDARFGLTGGEDAHFFEILRRRRGTAVWCDEAVVYETVSPERATAGWVLRRAFRGGTTYSASLVALGAPPRRRALRAATCVARFAQGAALVPLAVPLGRGAAVQALARCSVALGGLTGLAGYRYEEYGRA